MSTVTTSKGWMTNYIYEQDLTSAYMNSSLYSLFRPGVYNANIYVIPGKFDSSSDDENDGLNLVIKKGTTLVFSNDYFNDKSDFIFTDDRQVFRRSFTCEDKNISSISSTRNLIGDRFPLIIKCVAMSDIVVSGVAQSAKDVNVKDRSCKPWDGENDPPESLYLCAFMRYDQKNGGDFESIPTFRLFRNNPYYGESTSESEPSDKSRFFYIGTFPKDIPDYSPNNDEICWRLPDGCSNYDDNGLDVMMQYSYLMIGVFADNKKPTTGGLKFSYPYFSSEWFKSHTFTARCLPEYRNNMIGASNSQSPDFIVPLKSYTGNTENPKFSRLYIDFKNVINFGNVYDTSINWESAYDIADTEATSFPKFNHLDGIDNIDYVSYILTQDEKKIISESSNEFLVLDFTYALSKNVLNTQRNLDRNSDSISLNDFTTKDNKIKLANHRELIEIIGDLPEDIEGALKIEDNLMRLDISKSNVDLKLNLIKNNNILYRIMSKMRSSGEINPDKGESIIPVALAFRVLKNVNVGTEEEPLLYEIQGQCGDNITSVDSVNPINVLSLLDLEYKMTKLNSISNMSKDAFTILPVIE